METWTYGAGSWAGCRRTVCRENGNPGRPECWSSQKWNVCLFAMCAFVQRGDEKTWCVKSKSSSSLYSVSTSKHEMQIGEIVGVSANVCTCYSSNSSQFWCLLYGQLCVNTFLTPFRVHAYIRIHKRWRSLSFLLITSQNLSIGLHLWKDLIRHFDLIRFKILITLQIYALALIPRKPALYDPSKIKGYGHRCCQLEWDVLGSAVHPQQENH